MQFEPELAGKAFASARERLQNCHALINSYAEIDEYNEEYYRNEILEDLAGRLAFSVVQSFNAVRLAFELLGIDQSRRALEQGVEARANDLSIVDYYDEYMGPHNPVVDYLSDQLNMIAPLVKPPTKNDNVRNILFRMLQQFPYYIEERDADLNKEKDVQDNLERVLRLAFPDVIRNATTPKQTKTYIPDFGIDSIATAVEVKYVKHADKAPLAIGGLYEDMKGYADSSFSHFVALVYMTGNFMTQAQVDAELKKVSAPESWHVFAVVGT